MSLQRATSLDHDILLEPGPPDGATKLEGRWDGGRIEQIVMNLLNNAVKYSPRGGLITVGVTLLPNGYIPETRLPGRPRKVAAPAAHIAITDEGIGIPVEAQKRLFERFFRAGNTVGIQGTGLGLFICRQLAWAHGAISGSRRQATARAVSSISSCRSPESPALRLGHARGG